MIDSELVDLQPEKSCNRWQVLVYASEITAALPALGSNRTNGGERRGISKSAAYMETRSRADEREPNGNNAEGASELSRVAVTLNQQVCH